MRSRLGLTVLVFVWFAALAPLQALADVIVLKSGRRIEAWAIEERGERVYYETSEGRVAIPRRLVERIEAGGSLPRGEAPGAASLSALSESQLPALSDADVLRVTEGGKINRDLLAQLEGQARRSGGDPARLRAAAAHSLVARLEAEQGNTAAAAESLRRALGFAPQHPALLLSLAAVELEQQRYAAALEHLEPVLAQPQFAFEAYRLQGWIYYQREEMERAIAAWKKALAVRGDADLAAQVTRVEREARAVQDYHQRDTGRFVLRYPGPVDAVPWLASNILGALDAMYDEMASTFNFLPREPIVVLLYPNETFYELTGMPPEVHGLYDGKIRVPIEGLVSLSPRLEQTLRHELVHAFVFFKSRGRAPRWLQEGLAQWYAAQRPSFTRQSFLPLFERRDGTALARIEAAFDGEAAQVFGAYMASWFVVDTFERRYGRGDMERFLEALSEGESLEPALRRAFRLTLADLDREVYAALR